MTSEPSTNSTISSATGITFVIILACTFAGLFPGGRIWGLNVWAYQPWPVLIGVAVAAIGTVAWIRIGIKPAPEDGSLPEAGQTPPVPYRHIVILGTILVIPVFWFLQTETHFLGDGYQVISHLSTGDPTFAKITEPGEAYLHLALYRLLGEGRDAAMLSYRLLSVFAGVVAAAVTFGAATRLFTDFGRRLLFVGGLLTAGYSLLFFGYVEHYSLFVCAAIVFALTGLLALRGHLSRWIPLGAALAALALHVIGVALLPAALYLALTGRVHTRSSRVLVWGTSILAVIGGVVAFYHLYTTNYFFRFAFVPLVPIEITAEGYTLFSLAHLVDMANLVFILLPATPLLIPVLLAGRARRIIRRKETVFLLVMLISSFSAAFLLDPKLGMPRDWDLFSFTGIPLAVGFYYILLHKDFGMSRGVSVAALGIVLGVFVLGGRVAAQNDPDVAIARLRDYKDLDRAKNRAATQLLREYFDRRGDIIASQQEIRQWEQDYPEAQLGLRAKELIDSGREQEAFPLCKRAVRMNPLYWPGWTSLGSCYIDLGRWELAEEVLEIANGINPNNPTILHNLGYALVLQKEYDRAERLWRRTIELDNTMTIAYTNLARIFMTTKQLDQLDSLLSEVTETSVISTKWLVESADFYAERNNFNMAAKLYRGALTGGLDTAVVLDRLKQYPQLRAELSLPR